MDRQKRAVAIHDISCVGKCSLTVALPILSAAGIECSVLPTAILSTHTGGFTGYTFLDLTEEMLPIVRHWEKENIQVDALYSGYVGSDAQFPIIREVFQRLRRKDTLIMVDPVMADNGRYYPGFSPKTAEGMRTLCEMADVLVPNMTEAAFLLGEEYREGPYDSAYLEYLLKKLTELGPKKVVLTGVYPRENQLGAACISREDGGQIQWVLAQRMPGMYHGTGDIFASALLAALMKDLALEDATRIAVDYILDCIRDTDPRQEPRFGVNFERSLAALGSRILQAAEGTITK